MSPTASFTSFAQSVYRVVKGRKYDDISDDDGQDYLEGMVDWTNQYLDELENITIGDNELVNWKFARQFDASIGTATAGSSTASFDSTRLLLADEQRYVTIQQDGTIVSYFAVVDPSQIGSKKDRITEDSVTQINNRLIFSRELRDYEDGGTIVGDYTGALPRITYNRADNGAVTILNANVLNQVKPKQLLVLGTAKNVSLPDIVQGGLSPSYAQKYSDLLSGAITRNSLTSRSSQMEWQDFGNITGSLL